MFDSFGKTINVDILRRLLEAGVGCNEEVGFVDKYNCRASSAWREFLMLLVDKAGALPERTDELARTGVECRLGIPDKVEDDEHGKDLYSDPFIQDAIKLFVESGADLEPPDIEVLTTCLPKPNGKNFDWPQFLSDYSRPEKRAEFEEDQRDRIRRWPIYCWSDEDKQLMRSAPDPDLSGTWWSVRGRRLLELDSESSEDESYAGSPSSD